MPDLTLLLAHAAPTVGALFAAAAPPGVRVVPFISPHPGLSSAYDKLASELRDHQGRLLPGLRRWVSLRTGVPVLGPVAACWYSSGYALARALAQHPQDRAEVAGWIAIDGGHAGLDKDGTASDSGIAWAVGLAREAADGGSPLWYGHSDVRTADYASTTQVAAELRRLAGEPTGHWHCEAFDVAKADRDEHMKAATGWGPGFAARACEEILEALADVTEHTPLPDTVPRPRTLRRGDSGSDVGELQRRLNALGFDCGTPDDKFGPVTERAVRTFQSRNALAQDGVVGPATRAALDRKGTPPPRTATHATAGLGVAMLAQAQAYLSMGLRETSPNDGPGVRELFLGTGVTPPANWCAAFVRTCLRKAATELRVTAPISGSVGAKATMDQLKRAGRWIDAAELRKSPERLRRGMITVWDRSDLKRPETQWWGHIGIISSVSGSTFKSIEGNSGDRVAENDHTIHAPKLIGCGWID